MSQISCGYDFYFNFLSSQPHTAKGRTHTRPEPSSHRNQEPWYKNQSNPGRTEAPAPPPATPTGPNGPKGSSDAI